GRAGLLASATLPEGGLAIVRVAGDQLVIDATTPWEGKAPAPLELARRFPLAPAAPLPRAGARGARRILFGPGAAAVYVDGRRLAALMLPLRLTELRFGMPGAASAAELRKLRLAERSAAAACTKEWARAPAVFD